MEKGVVASAFLSDTLGRSRVGRPSCPRARVGTGNIRPELCGRTWRTQTERTSFLNHMSVKKKVFWLEWGGGRGAEEKENWKVKLEFK